MDKTKEPMLRVGILTANEIVFTLPVLYRMVGTWCSGVVTCCRFVKGEQRVVADGRKIRWEGTSYETLRFDPMAPEDYFELHDVVIGKQFHWERRENQRFPGFLDFISKEEGQVTAVNVVPLETYLSSVISSEMSATASPALLKAHAIISRSWLVNLLEASEWPDNDPSKGMHEDENERIRWYERDAHAGYDVCADDHCQRYQGITRVVGDQARQAVEETRGMVLVHGGRVCDARFSKCCGGALEEFNTCWANRLPSYLQAKRDLPASLENHPLPDLTREVEAEKWIRSSPEAFCHTTDAAILAQVLNDYDRETTDFFRWQVSYTQDELAALVRERSGVDFGGIVDLRPLTRGRSGRISRLEIVGTLRTMVIGKELEIRRTLSSSHLYSSAFVVDKEQVEEGQLPSRFVLTGAGWGHGVGLCQIGAAVMGEQGYTYEEILAHYYPNTLITQRYQ
ncbi:MAG: SpoIID/LytB domain-containing protein [Bacteroides sp.]|nr:SpoIID/LytB domain-containing protein [Bacteroides sp.]